MSRRQADEFIRDMKPGTTEIINVNGEIFTVTKDEDGEVNGAPNEDIPLDKDYPIIGDKWEAGDPPPVDFDVEENGEVITFDGPGVDIHANPDGSGEVDLPLPLPDIPFPSDEENKESVTTRPKMSCFEMLGKQVCRG